MMPNFRRNLSDSRTQFDQKLDEFEIRALLSDVDDPRDAILTIHPGAGGTESQDWAEMLLRLYTRWCEQRGFEADLIDYPVR